MSRRAVGTVLAVLGALLLADALLTVVWREPVSWLLHRSDQPQLERRLARSEGRFALPDLTAVADRTVRRAQMARAAARLRAAARPGDPLGRISIPAIKARFIVVQGTDPAELREGPGHYVPTALPGEAGTVGLAGHRTTYQQPFRSIDALRPGDRIELAMPYGRFTYRVTGTQVVAPSQVSVLAGSRTEERLVLTACHPLFSARKRLVVSARLASVTPRVRA